MWCDSRAFSWPAPLQPLGLGRKSKTRVAIMNLHTLREFHFGELESWWTPEFSEGNFRGQNSMTWRVFYINEKFLEFRYLKWARIAHLDIWNTSYGQKKGRESNCQFDSQPLKVGNQPDFRVCRWHATYCWKALNKGYNFTVSQSEVCTKNYGAPKSQESQPW